MKRARRLVLENLHNTRDLGGFPTLDGGVTSFGCFIRSEAPCNLSDSDLDALKAYGVTTLIDFRGEDEQQNRPNELSAQPWITFYSLPLHNAAAQGRPPRSTPPEGGPPMGQMPSDWGVQYIQMADSSQKWAVDVLTIAAQCQGVLMYNCTTGKDRTGLMTAMLLSIAGVPERDIVADYCTSMVYLEPVYEKIRSGKIILGPPPGAGDDNKREKLGRLILNPEFFKTPPEAMETLLRHLDNAYGGVMGYLSKIGVTDRIISDIRAKFISYN